ncbi:MAG: LacI family DNA-binding transcriptional regulator [Chloroflexota bacterium]
MSERNAIATVKDVAREVGLSVTTVSRALNNHSDVAEATRALIQEAANRLDYHPNSAARTLQNARASAIALIIPQVAHRAHDAFWLDFIGGMVAAAARSGYDLVLSAPDNHDGQDQSFQHLVRGRRVDGVLLCDVLQTDTRITYLRKHRLPFVAFGRTTDRHDYSYIDIDGAAGVAQGMEHLIELGHRRIGFLGVAPEFGFSHYRLAGYRQALMHAGIPLDATLVREGLRDSTAPAAIAAMLAMPSRPTAIFAAADFLALAVLRIARVSELTVPDDVSVVSFDDSLPIQQAEPPVTAIRQPNRRLGEEAAMLLLDRVTSPLGPLTQRLVVPTFIQRKSTAPPREHSMAALA